MEAVRLSVEADLPRLAELLDLAVGQTRVGRGGHHFRQPERRRAAVERLGDALKDSHRCLYTGLLDEYPVGFALLRVDSQPGAPVGVVEELFVEEQARGVGVGEQLLTTAVRWFDDQQCSGIDLAALPGDRATKNLCERMGFTARVLIMHKSLRGDEPS